MTHPKNTLSLVADVGGTNTRVALADRGQLLPDTVRKIRNATAASLEGVLSDYVAAEEVDCMSAAVAIAGPVDNGRGTLTNLDWSIDETILARVTQSETVSVLNDLQAQAFALSDLSQDKLQPVLTGQAASNDAPRLVIGFGTGLNAALALPTSHGKFVPASECGHITLPVRDADDLRLSAFISQKQGFASAEDVLSGRGMERLYAWHALERGRETRLGATDILRALSDGSDDVAEQAVRTYVKLMGRFVSDLALVHLPFGGIYLIGGVARAVSPYLDRFKFAESFQDKGRFSDFMTRFSVSIVDDDFAALYGMATHLHEMCEY